MSLGSELRSLRDEKGIPEPVILSTMLALEDLLSRDPVSFIELVEWCRKEADPLPETRRRLAQAGLLHDAVRDIVLVAVTGEGPEMALHRLGPS